MPAKLWWLDTGEFFIKGLGTCMGTFLTLICQSLTHSHGLYILVFSFQQIQISLSQIAVWAGDELYPDWSNQYGSFGKELSWMWECTSTFWSRILHPLCFLSCQAGEGPWLLHGVQGRKAHFPRLWSCPPHSVVLLRLSPFQPQS